jgi:hypothetical protein
MDRREHAAIHESGHCVVAALFSTCTGADIYRVGGRGGETRCEIPESCDQAIAIFLAGSLAVWEARWRAGLPLGDMSSSDLRNVDEQLSCWYHGDPPQFREQCKEFIDGESLARQCLSDYWGCVLRIAEWLQANDEISSELVAAIVYEHEKKRTKVNI